MAAVAGADLVLERLDILDISAFFKVCKYRLASLHGGHACVFAAVEHLRLVGGSLAACNKLIINSLIRRAGHMAVVGEGAHHGQIVTSADLKVVWVMGRCNLNNARTLCHIGVLVADNGDLFVEKRENDMAAVEMSVALVLGVDGNGGIAEHRLGSGGGKLKLLARLLYGVKKMPEVAVLLVIFDLRVGNRGLAAGAPVDHPVASVDKVFFIKAHKDFAHGLAAALVEGEAFSVPIAGGTELLELLDDASAVSGFPLPCSFEETVAADIVLGDAFFLHRLDYLRLGSYRSVVGAGHPKGIVALHSLPADKDILESVIKSVTHVKLAGDIRRRDNDRVGLFALLGLCVEVFALEPKIINTIFDILRVILLCKLLCHKNQSFLTS